MVFACGRNSEPHFGPTGRHTSIQPRLWLIWGLFIAGQLRRQGAQYSCDTSDASRFGCIFALELLEQSLVLCKQGVNGSIPVTSTNCLSCIAERFTGSTIR